MASIMRSVPHTCIWHFELYICRPQWPCGIRLESAAACLLRLRVRVPPVAWMSVCCECFVLSGRGVCDELITRPEGVLPTVVFRYVWCSDLMNEEALARGRPQRYTKENKSVYLCSEMQRLYDWSVNHVQRLSFHIQRMQTWTAASNVTLNT